MGAFTDAARSTGGLGAAFETAHAWEGGELSLRASADLENALGGSETTARVSGSELVSESAETRLLLGLGGRYAQGRFSMEGVGSDDAVLSGRVEFGWKF